MKARTVLFVLVPYVALLLLLETGARLWAAADPQLITSPLPEESGGLFRKDPLLFWSIKPGLDTYYYGQVVKTNSHGLRSNELDETKAPKEVRILSLGESTTFGTGVANGETYSDVLEDLLQSADSSRRYRVLNAGTPAHSSYQFRAFLEQRSLDLEPDVVLLYSELNDYLPTSIRDSSNNEIGVSMSDGELARAKGSTIRQWFVDHSVFFRAVVFARARSNIAEFQSESAINPLTKIGLPNIGLRPRLLGQASPIDTPAPVPIQEGLLPSRVLPKERRENLESMLSFCKEHDLILVIIHPAYRDSSPHECVLTRFSAANGIELFEAQPILHSREGDLDEVFFDDFHPSKEGHRRLAEGLAERVLAELAKN